MNIKFKYEETNELENLIQKTYFAEGKNGVKSKENNYLILNEDNIYHKILKGTTYDVKLKNDIINGSMLFKKEENAEEIKLVPESSFCIKKDGLYHFY
jgi:hypothetical protein